METEIEKPYVIGLDMGGTNSVFGIVDQRGTIKSQTVISTRAYSDFKDYVKASVEALQPALDTVGGIENVRAIGIGAPNANYYTGTIENAANLVWRGSVPCAQMFEDALGIPCRITNDANAAAMGEMTYGAARGMKNFIEITLGTGVGSGIVIDGKVVYGHDGFAGELGHTKIVHGPEGRQCGCGQRGCIEAYASATGVARSAKEIIENSTKETSLRKLENITSYDVFKAAEAGDEVAKEIFDFTGEMLGKKLADFVAFSAPEAIILFGGLTNSGHWIMDPIEKALNDNVMHLWKGKVKLLVSTLKDSDAAILGASSLAWDIAAQAPMKN